MSDNCDNMKRDSLTWQEMGWTISSVAMLGHMVDSPLLPSISVGYRHLWQEQGEAVGPVRGCLLSLEEQINIYLSFQIKFKLINLREQLKATYHITVFVFTLVQMKLHCNKFLFLHDELQKEETRESKLVTSERGG